MARINITPDPTGVHPEVAILFGRQVGFWGAARVGERQRAWPPVLGPERPAATRHERMTMRPGRQWTIAYPLTS